MKQNEIMRNEDRADPEPIFARATIFYDANCFLCRQLAAFAEITPTDGAQIVIQPLDEQSPGQGQQLYVSVGPETFAGEEAWAWLIANHPRMRAVGWIGEHLGIAPTAKIVNKVMKRVRRFCWRCY